MTMTNEAAWLQALAGTWSWTLTTSADSDHPGFTSGGEETVRVIGDGWLMLDSTGEDDDGEGSRSVTLVGWDPEKARFAGAVAGSAAPALFVYEGDLDADGALVLETAGPAMTEGRTTDRYRDVFRFAGNDRRSTSAQVLGEDGSWREFMRTEHRRTT